MKYFLPPVLTIIIACTSFAQNPLEPCCNVVGIHPAKNLVVARNNTTGRLFAFMVDAMDIKAVKLKDPVVTNAGFTTVTAINGAARKYKAEPVTDRNINYVEPVSGIKKTNAEPVNGINISNAEPVGIVQINYVEPCCSIVQIDKIEVCCSMVIAKNKTTGATIKFKAPALILSPLKIGDPVYVEPCCDMAIVQSSYQSNGGEMNSFGYPIENGSTNTEESSNPKWVIGTANMKGALGRLNTAFPSDVEWSIDVHAASDNKFITNRSGFSKHGAAYDLAPGSYHFRLNTILVEYAPIERGKETRLKAGVLHVVSEGDWEIYSETKEKFHTSGNKPKKIALPVGAYQLKLGGQFFPLVIKDGETVEY